MSSNPFPSLSVPSHSIILLGTDPYCRWPWQLPFHVFMCQQWVYNLGAPLQLQQEKISRIREVSTFTALEFSLDIPETISKPQSLGSMSNLGSVPCNYLPGTQRAPKARREVRRWARNLVTTVKRIDHSWSTCTILYYSASYQSLPIQSRFGILGSAFATSAGLLIGSHSCTTAMPWRPPAAIGWSTAIWKIPGQSL